MRHFLDVHAALGRGDERHPAGAAIDQQRQVEFLFDVGAVLDIEAVDLLARRTGLVGHQRVAQHGLHGVQRLLLREGEPHAALLASFLFLEFALAAPAGVNLGFHHPERPGKAVDGLLRVRQREHSHACRHGRPKFLEDGLCLVFMDIH